MNIINFARRPDPIKIKEADLFSGPTGDEIVQRQTEKAQRLQLAKQEYKKRIPNIRKLAIERNKQHFLTLSKKYGISKVGDKVLYPSMWFETIANCLRKQHPDFKALQISPNHGPSGRILTLTDKNKKIRLTLTLYTEIAVREPHDIRFMNFEDHSLFRELPQLTDEQFLDQDKGKMDTIVDVIGNFTYQHRSRTNCIFLEYNIDTNEVEYEKSSRGESLEAIYKDLKVAVKKPRLTKSQISLFKAAREASTDRDYETLNKIVTDLAKYYGQ